MVVIFFSGDGVISRTTARDFNALLIGAMLRRALNADRQMSRHSNEYRSVCRCHTHTHTHRHVLGRRLMSTNSETTDVHGDRD